MLHDLIARGVVAASIAACTGCLTPRPAPYEAAVVDLDRRYEALLAQSAGYGPGGRIVLDTAYAALRAGRAEGRWPAVGLEDLWTESIQEGGGLFNQPDRRWGKTTATETKDMIGQTTIGPWQITVTNVRAKYGLPYGVQPDWSDAQVYGYCRDHPDIQAKMIADYIEEAYGKYGRRGPYGIQRYFWLEGYTRGWIGQGAWDKSVLPEPPGGDWTKLTSEMKADTGFYAKQILVGWRGNPRGLLYWLWVAGDADGIRETLRTWRDQGRMVWDESAGDARLTEEPGDFSVYPQDLRYLKPFSECHAELVKVVLEVLMER